MYKLGKACSLFQTYTSILKVFMYTLQIQNRSLCTGGGYWLENSQIKMQFKARVLITIDTKPNAVGVPHVRMAHLF